MGEVLEKRKFEVGQKGATLATCNPLARPLALPQAPTA